MPKPPLTRINLGDTTCNLYVTESKIDARGYSYDHTHLEKEGIGYAELREIYAGLQRDFPNSNLRMRKHKKTYETIMIRSLPWAVLFGMIFMGADRLLPNNDRGGCF